MIGGKILSADITDIARLQHLAGRYRPYLAMLVAGLSVGDLGPTKAAAWISIVLACELWTWVCTRPALTRMLSPREMVVYILSGAATMPAWSALGVLFWLRGTGTDAAVAVALWVVQLLYTQRFVFQSYLAVLMGNAIMVVVMVAVPIVRPVLHGGDQIIFEIALLFAIAFAISASLAAFARVRSLADQNAVIARAAITDELTSLPNRARFARALDAAVAAGAPVCVLYMDLDRFKLVNDTLGHQAGDTLLRQFAGRLLEVSPPGATVARLGGDEFAALIGGADFTVADAEALCRAILQSVKAPFATASGQAHVGVSIGVARTDGDTAGSGAAVSRTGASAIDADDLMRRADIALYTMKATGRDGYRLFTDELEMEVKSRTDIEAALRETLATGSGLSLAYQPKVDARGAITGVEALLRWQMDGRPVSPAIFVPIAEETGLIVAMGEWVLHEAIGFAGRWPALCVAVNLSPAQLRDGDFAQRLIDRVAAARLVPARIELEVTETTLFESTSYALGALDALRAAGLRVALDDFGTGYSSLRHLHSVSVDRVKIDQSFVAGLGRSLDSAAIVSAVVQLAHSMGLQITAEGVETAVQRDFLIEAGADELQGFLFAEPLAEQALAAWIDRRRLALAA